MSLTNEIGVVLAKSNRSLYEWDIDNFVVHAAHTEAGDCFVSPVFSSRYENLVLYWRIEFYPKGDIHTNPDCISLFIRYLGTDEVIAAVNFSFITGSKHETLRRCGELLKFDADLTLRGYSNLVRKSYITDETNHVLVNDTLKIRCEIVFVPSIDTQKCQSFNDKSLEDKIVPQYRLQVFDNLEQLFESGKHSDVTIKIGEDRIKAHKAILTNRSSVFETMFDNDMKEKENNEIEVLDIKPEVMKEILRFLYASKVINIDEIAWDLLIAAEKYMIEDLKTLSEKTLFEHLTVTNALEYLRYADLYNATKLKSKVIQFIVKHQQIIIDDPQFQQLMSSHTILMWTVIRAMISSKLSC